MFIAVLGLLGLTVLIVGGFIALIVMRNGARKKARAAKWPAVAEELGGTFQNDTIQISRSDYSLNIKTVGVSVAQAMSSPYYPDGGTFTLATLTDNVKVSEVGAPIAVLNPDEFKGVLPRCSSHVVIAANNATVVMHGSVIDTTDLTAAVAALETMHRKASSEGPFQDRG